MRRIFQPDLLLVEGAFRSGYCLVTGDDGRIAEVREAKDGDEKDAVKLAGKALLPGFVNAHSHTFQRLIRGSSEHRGTNGDDFWSWREAMYRAALSVEEGDVYDVARMAFLEMALAGTTAVGEFHYLHNAKDGQPYEDANCLAKQVIAAAQSVGVRIALLRVAYMRAGYELPPSPGQRRFYESPDAFLRNAHALGRDLRASEGRAWLGVAPHSIRALRVEPLEEIAAWAKRESLPIHMHVAEQPAELAACVREYGATPVDFLAKRGLLSERFTLVHGIHINAAEMDAIANSGATICSCPTTERNLGDGILAAREAVERGIQFAFGSDSQTLIDPLEDARQLEYHVRLNERQRVLLDGIDGVDMSERLFGYATAGGARSIGLDGGWLRAGDYADFFTVDLADVSLAGASRQELLATLVFSGKLSAVRDVAVHGDWIVREGKHPLQDEIVNRYAEVSRKVWRA